MDDADDDDDDDDEVFFPIQGFFLGEFFPYLYSTLKKITAASCFLCFSLSIQ